MSLFIDQGGGRWAPLPLRVALGGGLMYHGGIKLFVSGGHDNIAQMIAALGVPGAEVMAWITGFIECFGGSAMLVGLWTRPAAAVNALNMIGLLVLAALRGGIPEPLPGGDPLPGMEMAFLILAGTLCLTLTGSGAGSLDGVLRRR